MSANTREGLEALYVLNLLVRFPDPDEVEDQKPEKRRRIEHVFELRGVPLTPAERQRVAECDNDALLYRWLVRAAFAGPPRVFRDDDEDIVGAPTPQ